jgi:E3 ubiquitin-protein ligase UBR1
MLVGEGTGGCCDCGDPEAFHPSAPRCGIHVVVPEREVQPLPEDLRRSIWETMATALDFAIDIFSTTPMMKEEVKEDVCKRNAEESQLVYAPSQHKEQEDYGDWIAILWNDDIRSYNDVQSQLNLIDPERYDEEGGYIVAKKIDTVGREAIVKDPSLRTVVSIANTVMRVGLFCSVRTERDYLRECIAGYILEWLMDCIAVGVSVGGDEMILREIMCQILAKPWMRGIKQLDSRVELVNDSDEDHLPSSDWATNSPNSGPVEERWVEGQYIRLDWILFFDARLWKSLRKCIKSIIMGCILGGKAKVAGTAVDPWGPRNWKRITG